MSARKFFTGLIATFVVSLTLLSAAPSAAQELSTPTNLRLRNWRILVRSEQREITVESSLVGEADDYDTAQLAIQCLEGTRYFLFQLPYFYSSSELESIFIDWGVGELEERIMFVYEGGLVEANWRFVERLVEHDDDLWITYEDESYMFDIRGIEDALNLTEWLCVSLGILPETDTEE